MYFPVCKLYWSKKRNVTNKSPKYFFKIKTTLWQFIIKIWKPVKAKHKFAQCLLTRGTLLCGLTAHCPLTALQKFHSSEAFLFY